MFDAQNIQFLLIETNAPEHQPVSPQALNGIDPHAPHHLHDLVLPGGEQIDQPAGSHVWIQPLDQFRNLGGDAPVAAPGVAASAEVATACAQKSPAQYKLATWYLQDTAFSKR